MNIAILGFGKEGKSAEKYFTGKNHEVAIFDDFTLEDLTKTNFDGFDLILRSPSVHPHSGWSSITRYFFEHCPCPIIGVTGTKGKGTTCTLITDLLRNLNESENKNKTTANRNIYLVGNIGTPAIDILDRLCPDDIVIYEMSSFQLWDLEKSPHVAVILGIEPDHLNVHDDLDDYVSAKSNICRHQTSNDYCIYYQDNPVSAKIAQQSPANKLAYPTQNSHLTNLLNHLSVPGQHNRDNAEAALLAVSQIYGLTLDDFINQNRDIIIKTFAEFKTLPHRLEFLRELNHVKYYDDNFSTTPTSLEVAVKSFPDQNVILIAGGRDKTNNADLPEIAEIVQSNPQIKQIILIGESGKELQKLLTHSTFAETLPEAVECARRQAESFAKSIVLMSPAAASFDMFENVYDRGAQFQELIKTLQ